jgi:SEC-C motif-containing protein
MSKLPKLCPCGTDLNYTVCCGKFHKGKIHAATAEALMRSRYSAYVLDLTQYIFRTWDETTRPTLQSLRDGNTQQFIALKVLSTSKGGVDDVLGTVEFIATYKVGDELFEHHENSRFKRHKNRWVYVEPI